MKATVGSRLKEERERLGFSRSEFAEKTGVHRNTLARYEAGEREPDHEYLLKADSLGVDFGYVVSGRRTDAVSVFPCAVARVLPWIADRAGLSSEALLDLLDLAAEEEVLAQGPLISGASSPDWSALIDALFENGALLAQAFTTVRNVSNEHDWTLSCWKHSQAVLMIYQSLRNSGKVAPEFVHNVVALARD